MNHLPSLRRLAGFTLIELIVVVAIIAIIAATVFVALDPGKRLHVSRNSRRWSDVTTVIKAVKLYEADNASLPAAIDAVPATVQMLGSTVTCPPPACTGVTFPGSNCTIDLSSTLRSYLKAMPIDPTSGSGAGNTRYYVNASGSVLTVGACNAEGEGSGGSGTAPTITVSQ